MRTINATYAKQNFGICIDKAFTQPVIIEKYGQPSVVMISYEEFQRLSSMAEEEMWVSQAQKSASEGYLTTDDTEVFMQKRLARALKN